MKRYKIKVPGLETNDSDGTQLFPVLEDGNFTYVCWYQGTEHELSLTYTTKEVNGYLEEGRWIKVEDKKSFKSKNLFSFDDI